MFEDDVHEVRIGIDPGAFAVISRPELDHDGYGSIPVRIEDKTLRASSIAEMASRPATDLAAYFEEMARDWRGWTGRRDWHDDDRQVELSATHNGKSLVGL